MKKYLPILLLLFLVSCTTISYISVKSDPPKSKVYIISKWEAEKKSSLLSDTNYLKKFQINEGLTPAVIRVRTKKYKVITVLNGKIEIRDADTSPRDTTKILIIF
jgi:hypothetical protein